MKKSEKVVEKKRNLVECDALIEECCGFTIEQRIEPLAEPQRSHSISKEEQEEEESTKRKITKQRTVMDGLVIVASGDANRVQAISLKAGEFVVWFSDKENNSTSKERDVNAGMVMQHSSSKHACLVKVIDTIPAAPTDRAELRRQKGQSVWVADECLCKVQPRRLPASARKYGRRSLENNKDGTLDPRLPPRRRDDGTFVPPAGRKPKGYSWCQTRGLWVSTEPI